MEFKKNKELTLGVEYELQLLDRETFDLTDGILPLLARLGPSEYIKSEYNQCTVEVASKIVRNAHELEAHLREEVSKIREVCHGLGMRLCGGATHPFRRRLAAVMPGERYRRIERESGYAGYVQMVCAMHVHVGMASGKDAIRMMQRVRPYLALLLALSASSPFYMGEDTGFAAYRPRVLLAAHSYGTAPVVRSWPHFVKMWEAARQAGIWRDFKDHHWDIRPKPDLGTLELRIMDSQPTVKQTVALAVVVHALIAHLNALDRLGKDFLLPPQPLWLEVENAYRGAHSALEAMMVIDADGNTRLMRELVAELLEALYPVARERDEADFLDVAGTMLDDGPGYVRQRRVHREGGSLGAVAEDLVRQLDEELSVMG